MADTEARDAYAPYAEPEVFQSQDSRNKPGWAWRCWGSATCEGWVGIDLYSEEAARRELDRHIADDHKEPDTVSAPLETDPRGDSGEVQNCRSEEGQATGLIDSLLFISREVATKDLSSKNVQAALEDLLQDPAFQKVLAACPREATTRVTSSTAGTGTDHG